MSRRVGTALSIVALMAGAVGVLALSARYAETPRSAGASSADAHRAGAPSPDTARGAALVKRAEVLVRERRRFGYRVLVRPAKPGTRAELDPARHTLTLFVDPRDAAHRIAHDFAHELGHAYDEQRMDPAARRAYLARRGVPAARWWPSPAAADYRVGAGDFAEVYALCHAASPEFRSRLAPRPANACAQLPAGAQASR
jgi:hypothetical protein